MRRGGRDRYTPARARAAASVDRCVEELRTTIDIPDDYVRLIAPASYRYRYTITPATVQEVAINAVLPSFQWGDVGDGPDSGPAP